MRTTAPRIVATQVEATREGFKFTRVVLPSPPVATVSDVESVMGGWWSRPGGYSVGCDFGGRLE